MNELYPDSYESAVASARQTLLDAVKHYRPRAVVGLMSGGTDSHCATHLAASTLPVDFVAHINTQTGIRQTRDHVVKTCAENGWPLREYTPPMIASFGGKRRPVTPTHPDARTAYEAYVYYWGFPGPRQHAMIYARLKERCVRQLVRECKRKPRDKILLVSGVRRAESKRRMGYGQAVQQVGSQLWVAPLLFWDDEVKNRYLAEHGIVRSEVSRLLCMSGECLCGCYAKPNELKEIALWYPEAAAYLRDLEARVKAAGVGKCVWGVKPPPLAPSPAGPARGRAEYRRALLEL